MAVRRELQRREGRRPARRHDGRLAAPVSVDKPVDMAAHMAISDPAGKFVFLAVTGADRIFQYKLDQATGS